MVEYCDQFLRKVEVIKPYIVEFEKNSSIKPKIYFKNYTIGGIN